MARRLILDSGILITIERGRTDLMSALADDDLAISAITVAELRTGIELASPRHRAARTEFLLSVLEVMPVEPYGLETAEAHGRLLAFANRAGKQRGAHDLIIAATAVATGRILVTTDRSARFQDLPGVECLVLG